MNKNFDPYLDYEAVTDEMAVDLQSAIRQYDYWRGILADQDDPTTEAAVGVLKAQNDIQNIVTAIHQIIYTMPAMVHEAGETVEDVNEAGTVIRVQRCKRCGSVLNFWHEGAVWIGDNNTEEMDPDKLPWWKVGSRIAKSTSDMGMAVYLIDNERDLLKHEHACLDLSDLADPDV